MSEPLISIILPTRNRLSTIKRTVDSILAQSFQAWELVISDNASDEPGKWEYVEGLAAADGRIRAFRQETNIGIHKNWRFCIEQAAGEFYIAVTDDDWWGDDRFLEKLLAMHDGQAGVVFPNMCIHYPEAGKIESRVLTDVYSGAKGRPEICARIVEDRRGALMIGLFNLKVVGKDEIIAAIDNKFAAGIEVIGMNRIARGHDVKYCDDASYHHMSYGGNYCRSLSDEQVWQDLGIVGFKLLAELRGVARSDESYSDAFQKQWIVAVNYCLEISRLARGGGDAEGNEDTQEQVKVLRNQLKEKRRKSRTLRGALAIWWGLRKARRGGARKQGGDPESVG